MTRLEGHRIYIRDHIESDIDAYFDWISDSRVMKHLTWKETDREKAFARLLDAIREADAPNRSNFFFAIVEKQTDEMIGDVGFSIISRGAGGGIGELGYFLRHKYFGQGYGLEASRLVLDFAFDSVGLHKVVASCAADNTASERLMLKLGMNREGQFRREYFHDGEWRDRVRYAAFATADI